MIQNKLDNTYYLLLLFSVRYIIVNCYQIVLKYSYKRKETCNQYIELSFKIPKDVLQIKRCEHFYFLFL